jgi:hypothetical protein
MALDLDTFLTAVYTVVDDLYRERLAAALRRRPGPAPTLSDSEVLTLAICAEWGPWDSERGFWRFARRRLRHRAPDQVRRGLARAETQARLTRAPLMPGVRPRPARRAWPSSR